MNDMPSRMNDDPMYNAPIASTPRSVSASADAEVNRAIAEVQGAIVLAKKFPRHIDNSIAEIKAECSRVALAEVASYEYAKGGTKIDGPSIRLAEALQLSWGNIHSGWRELDRKMINGDWYSELEAYAWELEKNKRESVLFKVKLTRDTKKGSWPLKDEREIYEHCANQAKRRERACIIACIPGYVVDMAVDACAETLKKTVNADTTAKMIATFKDRFNVSKEQIEKFIQCDIAAITPAQVVRLRQIANSLKDGMSKADEWFDVIEEPKEPKPEGKGAAGLKEKLASKKAENLTTSPEHVQTVDTKEEANAPVNPTTMPPTGQIFTQSSTAVTKPEIELGHPQHNATSPEVEPSPSNGQKPDAPECAHDLIKSLNPTTGQEVDICAKCGFIEDRPAFLRNKV